MLECVLQKLPTASCPQLTRDVKCVMCNLLGLDFLNSHFFPLLFASPHTFWLHKIRDMRGALICKIAITCSKNISLG